MENITLLFDLDDTLIKTTKHYIRTQEYFVDLFNEFNIENNVILKLIEEIDLKLLKEHKYGYHWYQKGLEEVYKILSNKYRCEINNVFDLIDKKIEKEFKTKRELRKNVEKTLSYFYKRKVPMFIMTLGDDKIQNEKINNSDIKHFFNEIFVVKKKDINDFKKIIYELNLDVKTTFFIGNSIESDIIPARKVGFKTILLNKHTTFYNKKVEIPEGTIVISDLFEITKIINSKDIF